ncbi:DNA mismatch repair protein [Serendipita sp. 399]|nr:DNA mismatch repair protein [Serendipita sp. 399]
MNHLDSDTRSKLRSTQILTSLAQLTSELVQNALDANASVIEVGINAAEWECWVRDNGCGMSKLDMQKLAYATTNENEEDALARRYIGNTSSGSE